MLELLLGQSSSDEHKSAIAPFVRFPEALRGAFEEHMEALDHEALVVILHRNDALRAKDVRPEILRNLLNPGNKAFGIERAVGDQGQAADFIVVFMVVLFGEKSRLEFENAVEIEGVTTKHLGEIDAAAFGTMNAGIGIDPANARFDRGEVVSRDQIGLVE